MDEQEQSTQLPWDLPTQPPKAPTKPFFPTKTRECVFGIGILITSWLLYNSMLYGGFNLGFSIFASLSILLTTIYLVASGCKLTGYSGSLLAFSLVIAASFARGDDVFVKFILFCFLLVSVNLGFCLLAGQNRRAPAGLRSLADVPRTMFMLGIGKLQEAFRGLGGAFRRGGTAAKRGGSILLGLAIAVPVLCILIPLLTSADAAFEAVLELLPEWDISELLMTLIVGTGLACWLYTRGAALRHAPKAAPVKAASKKGLNPLTVNTVLIAVCLVYCVYLVSQLAYFAGGFSGILPEAFTVAQYARRGFFEMAWLCAVDLTVISLAVGLVRKQDRAPLATRLLCLFIGMVTLFLVATASAKMFLYIGSYGLTRLRVLTEVVMVWLGITTLIVTVWLFVPKLPYMKAVLLIALLMGAAVAWADVDTVVAKYNVSAYQSGQLENVDMEHLSGLGDGALPYIHALTQDSDPEVAAQAQDILEHRRDRSPEDFRGWNYVNQNAVQFLPAPETETAGTQ